MHARRQYALAINLFKLVTGRCYDRAGLPALSSELRIVACLGAEALTSHITSAIQSTRGSAFVEFVHFTGAVEHTLTMLFDRNANVSKEIFELLLV